MVLQNDAENAMHRDCKQQGIFKENKDKSHLYLASERG